ncbi:MAG: energy transducer TonB [Thermodesulfobacteriota bacterium]
MLLTGLPPFKNIDFFREIKKNQWKLPILGSILVHVFILGGSILSSSLFPDRDIQEIHTVELVNIEETPPGKKQEAQKAQPPPEQKPEKMSTEIVKKNTEQEVRETAPEEVASLKPRLSKKKIDSPEKSRERDKEIDEALEKIRKKVRKKRAEELARRAEEEARTAAREALNDLSDMLQSQGLNSNQEIRDQGKESDTVSGTPGSTEESSPEDRGKTGSSPSRAVLNQYLATVHRKIQANWILPEVTDGQEDLGAVISITVNRQGTLVRSQFEKHSDNVYFNRFIEKTIKRSSPLPPFPDTLKKEKLEIGLIFHPEGLQ